MKRFVISAAIAAGLALVVGGGPARAGDRAVVSNGTAALGLLDWTAAMGTVSVSDPARSASVAPASDAGCFVERRRLVDEFGYAVIRRVRVCD